jgi:2-dehydro-3-deoxyphosphooctonate aldolase (KDO 8-P synthase)
MNPIRVGRLLIGGGAPLSLIAGPCVIEDETKTLEIARYLKELTGKLSIPFIF